MELRLFVISDLHAFDGATLKDGARRPSHIDISQPKSLGAGDPLDDLKARIAKYGITAEYLVCGGDLGDRATPLAIEHAWKEVNEIGHLLNTKAILSAVGNHDVDSRHSFNDHDARGLLLELSPCFPFAQEAINNQFWTHHFVSFDDPESPVRFVIVNSSAYHGEKPEEYEHGRVSDRTRKRLLARLRAEGPRMTNVLICHHHPHKHSELKLGDYDDMRGGYDLLSALNAAEFGPWLIIHGHKHHPKLSYAQGGAAAPLVFSAGSCAGTLDSDVYGRNQVYLVTIEINGQMKSTPCGTFVSWDWAPGRGWSNSRVGSGLPARGGFGFMGDPADIARQIAKDFPEGGKWSTIMSQICALRYMLPDELDQLRMFLRRDHHYAIEEGAEGLPAYIDK